MINFWDMFLFILFAAAVTVGAIHGAATYVEVSDLDGIYIDRAHAVSWRQ